ncbi:Rid family hydrolase [Achromobacter sp. UMC71]|uniref:Rid family hydrolase n=1 Tax=Achromobacter sp. UMC71 TaxID=1862320 RepID=UPI0015FF1373|nr:Rid family hydrolase [Achromobacter sp. UMC71]MBB1628232.1 translation initiation inhibitor, yjgF family protein [Achromobacter sp. UMC71]
MIDLAAPDTRIVPTRTGMVAIPASLESDVAQFHYAPARRAGDFVLLSGIVVSNPLAEPMGEAAFCDALRHVFEQISHLLAACGAHLDDVTELQMFHVFGSAHLALDKNGQLAAIARVRDEFFSAPYPAAVELGVAQLNPPGGIVEIKATAYTPGRN